MKTFQIVTTVHVPDETPPIFPYEAARDASTAVLSHAYHRGIMPTAIKVVSQVPRDQNELSTRGAAAFAGQGVVL